MFITGFLCLQSKGTRISLRKQDDFVIAGFRRIRNSTSRRWLQKIFKHVGPNFTLKPSTKASSLQFCKTKGKQILVARKIKSATDIWRTCQRRRPLPLNKTSKHQKTKHQNISSSKERKEEVTEVLNEVMFVFCLPGRYSLVFIDERHQLELNF